MQDQKKQNRLIIGLTMIAMVAMIAAYFSPIWWVSLTAPNYPKDAFPDGIRIHFHFDKVYNGCKAAGKGTRMADEIIQGDIGGSEERYNPIIDKQKDVNKGAEGLDCVHEMNTINHYVGMFPIATGAPVEKPMAKFFFGFFVVMLLGFITPVGRKRILVLAAGFTAVAAWMLVHQYAMGNLEAQAKEYVDAAGTFFKEPGKIEVWGDNVRMATHATIIGVLALMVIVLAGVARIRGFSLMLVFVPALLPVFFVIEYAGWLWFFGHNMHPWGAFTVKPFMPTVFGEGKVAQFSTYSYPYWGYGLLLIVFACLMMALLLRRRQLRENQES
jgi:ABC-type multidrug transport system fused ATPase/permease subunit